MKLVGIDPGLRHTGLCVMWGAAIECDHISLAPGAPWQRMADLVASFTLREMADVVGIEDFQFRSPKVSHGLVKHAADMGKLIGWLVAALESPATTVVLVPAHEAQVNQPKGRTARAAGIPGRNDHERSAYNVAAWVHGSMRLAGGTKAPAGNRGLR